MTHRSITLLMLPLCQTRQILRSEASAFHRWARFELGLPLTAAAVVAWAVATVRLRGNPSTRWRLPVFAAHTALAGPGS